MAELDLNNQMEKTNGFKEAILKRIEDTEAIFERRDNDLLAAVLYKYYGRDNYDGATITEDDYIGDKSTYIEFLSADKEDVKKAIAENKKVYEKQKSEIKNSIIDFLKFKAELYNFNKNAIEELENEILSRKKESCKLNEEIIATEQEISNIEQEIAKGEQEYLDISKELVEIQEELDNCKNELNNPNLTDEQRQTLSDKKVDLMRKKDSVLDRGSNVLNNNNLLMANASKAKNNLNKLQTKLNDLDISNLETKVKEAKEANEQLKESINKDRDDFAAVGFDITEKDILPTDDSPKKDETPEETKTGEVKNHSGKSQGNEGIVTNTPQQSSNLPATQTPAQRAQGLKESILSASDEELTTILANNSYSDILAAAEHYNKKDRKALMEKIGKMNSPIDAGKLSNVITAIQKSGFCSGLDISSLISSDGKLKDFGQLSNEELDSLNNFITEIQANKDFIDDDQLDFIQKGFIDNVKYNSLKQALEPKKFLSFLQSKNARDRSKLRDSKLTSLRGTISSIPPKKVETPTKSSDFFTTLSGNTRDNIEPPTNTRPPQSKEQPTR